MRSAIVLGLGMYVCTVAGLSFTAHAQQARALTDGVFSAAQAQRGAAIYKNLCLSCHGETLSGGVGPMLTGDGFVNAWAGRTLGDLVDKIQNTMPLQAPGTLTRQQATDVAAYMLQAGRFPAGQAELTTAALPQVRFPAARAAAAAAGAGGGLALAPAGNLAQIMRGVTFPNANIIFNVQVKDPGVEKPVRPVPFDYVLWGATVYYGWQAVDQAALALIETTPLFLLPNRRCENGRPAPVDRADWKQFTQDLVNVSRDIYKASQTRKQDAVVDLAEKLNEACANCHKVYRDVGQEGQSGGAARCM
jgi:quinoprotein glucose dehydrogenase